MHQQKPFWHLPLPLELRLTELSESYRDMPSGVTGLPVAPHPGAFGVVRRHHVHEGVDLYCEPGTPVYAVEAGFVASVSAFTGPATGSPWWLDTEAVMVEGVSGVVLYGELQACVRKGDAVHRGQLLGHVVRVLRHDKGRPTAMLHLELHSCDARCSSAWNSPEARPQTLRDPTPLLAACIQH